MGLIITPVNQDNTPLSGTKQGQTIAKSLDSFRGLTKEITGNNSLVYSGRGNSEGARPPVQTPDEADRRIRITPKTPAAKDLVLGAKTETNVLSILHNTNGVMFPYTPTINVSYTADWQPYALTHTNYHTQTFAKSAIESISISGQFTAQTTEEALYTYACMHFFKTVTKMYYGRTDDRAGSPPPVLALSGYGNGTFNAVPVVIRQFQQTFDDSVDMVEVRFQGGKGSAWIPTISTVYIELGVSHDLRNVRDNFNLDRFRTGELLISSSNRGFL